MASSEIKAAMIVVVSARKMKLATPSVLAKRSADPTLMRPVTSGRAAVRAICASISASTMQLKTLALAALRVPPTSVAAISVSGGNPWAASSIAGTVVIRRSSTIRGLVSAT
jgi:hypothetical protein